MKKILINYAHNRFYESQKLNTKSAYEVGGFDKVFECGLKDIDPLFQEKNKNILSQSRGAGYWCWKSYLLDKYLKEIDDDDILFYIDAASIFIHSIDSLIEVFKRDNLDVMTFRQNHLSYIWTKRDTFILTNTDNTKYTHTAQRVGGVILTKKSEFSKMFFQEYLHYSQDYRILTDSPNELGKPNYDGFRDHRHDESLISILAKKYNLYPYRSPLQHGIDDDIRFTNNRYDQQGYNEMVKKFGPMSEWGTKYGSYFHGETLSQYPPISIDDKSTYPTIIELTRNPN